MQRAALSLAALSLAAVSAQFGVIRVNWHNGRPALDVPDLSLTTSCGAHRASSCARCPWFGSQWIGANWCNGDCRWRGVTPMRGDCVPAASAEAEVAAEGSTAHGWIQAPAAAEVQADAPAAADATDAAPTPPVEVQAAASAATDAADAEPAPRAEGIARLRAPALRSLLARLAEGAGLAPLEARGFDDGDGWMRAPTEEEDEREAGASLRAAALDALRRAKPKLLATLLSEQGRACKGCAEKEDFVRAVVDALASSNAARPDLALMNMGQILFPHTTVQLHLFEGRFRLMAMRALRTERAFGMLGVTGVRSIGTVAHITRWKVLQDGRLLVTVVGGKRFEVARQWEEDCEQCTSGPLVHARAELFDDDDAHHDGNRGNDDAPPISSDLQASAREAWRTAYKALRLYRQLLPPASAVHAQLEQLLGSSRIPEAIPEANGDGTSSEAVEGAGGPFAVSMWFAAACDRVEHCRASADDLERLYIRRNCANRLGDLLGRLHFLWETLG